MAGAGYKLFNTGDVLTAAQVNTYLMEQTVMVFADAAARTTALTGVVSEGMISYLKDTNAVEVYNGSAWVASDDPNAIQNTIVDAKGDLIAASAADTPARLAVGDNGESLVADSSTSTGLRYQSNFAAGKNKIINGDFNIWQRGTSFSNPASGSYLTDRFVITYDGSGATRTISRETFTPGTAPVAGYEGNYFFRYARTVAGTGATADRISQNIENVTTLAGQTATLSFWAKVDSGTPSVTLRVRQNFGSGGSSFVDTDASVTLSTTWTRYTATLAIPSISGKTIGTNSILEIQFRLPVNTIQTFDFWGVQIEAGSVATAFQTATGTLAGELAACQRYYFRSADSSAYAYQASGYTATTTSATYFLPHPVQMRTAPSSIEYANLAVNDISTNQAVTALIIDQKNSKATGITATVASGLTANRPSIILNNNNTGGYVALSAEL